MCVMSLLFIVFLSFCVSLLNFSLGSGFLLVGSVSLHFVRFVSIFLRQLLHCVHVCCVVVCFRLSGDLLVELLCPGLLLLRCAFVCLLLVHLCCSCWDSVVPFLH